MSVINATPLLAAAGGDYQISRSVRLRSSASAYFNRTPASITNRTTWTFSTWLKRGALGVESELFNCFYATDNKTAYLRWNSDNTLTYFDYNATGGVFINRITTTQVFRDPSAWYHIVLVYDTTNATASDRLRFYINGERVNSLSIASYPSLNYAGTINTTASTTIGRYSASGSGYFDGYLTEINFIDGQALTPSSFGETDSITGVWKPKKYTGTYGTNGFYLNFSDNSSNTATTIGKDYSGNGNNWTPNNISVTAGVTYDSMLDVPTMYADGGNGRGNYAVLNPLDNSQGAGVIADGNLKVSYSASGRGLGTIFVDSGKWYAEFTAGQVSTATNADAAGVCGVGTTSAVLRGYAPNGQYYNGSAWAAYGATYTAGDVIGVAVDVASQTLEFFKNGTSQGQKTSIGLSTLAFVAWAQGASGNNIVANFGQRPFAYTPPTGFKALNTQNLPEPTIKKGNQYFDATLYTGNGSTQSIVNAGGFQPDLVWAKSRGIGNVHQLFDSVRGVFKALYSNLTNAETNDTATLSSFNSNGFSLASSSGINTNADPLVAWQWKESPSAGFDIVTYTGTGANTTVAHSLGVAPSMIIIKIRSSASDWVVYHANVGNTKYLQLSTTAAAATASTVWNNTTPTSTVFSLGSSVGVNQSTSTYVAYLFSEVAGFSKFGSYTGNGSADGPFVFCGFRPKFVLIKSSSAAGTWTLWDSSRSTANSTNLTLAPNSSAAEVSAINIDFLSNGFKVRHVGDINASSVTSIYAAFAEHPFKNSLAR